jgi:hypothetical protein
MIVPIKISVITKTQDQYKATAMFSNKMPSGNSNIRIIVDRNQKFGRSCWIQVWLYLENTINMLQVTDELA